jgi:DNA-directed RNA polymerase subunit RPC12/RpoP
VIASAANLSERRLYSMAQAYCMKCKRKVEIKSPKQVTLKNKRAAIQGLCPKCGTKVFRMGKA